MDITSGGVNNGEISLKSILKKLEVHLWVIMWLLVVYKTSHGASGFNNLLLQPAAYTWLGVFVPKVMLTHGLGCMEIEQSGDVVAIMMALVEETSARLANTLSL
ncbi:hypothetical protein Tco_0024927 [Tanacetum coccineum]